MDDVCITDDLAFAPDGSGRVISTEPLPPAGVRASGEGCFLTELSWTPSQDPMVVRYNVYAAGGREFLTNRLISSPIERTSRFRVATVHDPSFTDWGLRPDTEYRYRVTSVSRFGAESALSHAVSIRTARPDRVHRKVQLEKWPSNVDFDIAQGGRYVVWARVCSREEAKARRERVGRVALAIRLGDGRSRPWQPRFDLVSTGHAGPFPNQPFWDRLPLGDESQRAIFTLEPGQHKLCISKPQAWKVEIQELVLTNDLSYCPKGRVSSIHRD